MHTEECAYDYTTQQWITGARAVELRLEQCEEQLALIRNNTHEYATFLGPKKSETVDALEADITRLRAMMSRCAYGN